jgi:beta-lactamase regulating signal transducer with metallopeptidase domain
MIYRRSPALIKNYKPGNIPADFDRRMREAAWKAIVDHPLAHIDDADGDGIGDLDSVAE